MTPTPMPGTPPDPTTQGKSPWWQRAALGGVAGLGAAPQQPPRPNNPWPQFGAAMGKLAGAGIAAHAQRNSGNGPALPSDPSDPSRLAPGTTMGPTPIGGSDPDADIDTDIGDPMASGRVVTKPTLALIGEDTPEAVVPLGYRADAKTRPSMAMPAGRNYYGG